MHDDCMQGLHTYMLQTTLTPDSRTFSAALEHIEHYLTISVSSLQAAYAHAPSDRAYGANMSSSPSAELAAALQDNIDLRALLAARGGGGRGAGAGSGRGNGGGRGARAGRGGAGRRNGASGAAGPPQHYVPYPHGRNDRYCYVHGHCGHWGPPVDGRDPCSAMVHPLINPFTNAPYTDAMRGALTATEVANGNPN
jgi:hypothetical protein